MSRTNTKNDILVEESLFLLEAGESLQTICNLFSVKADAVYRALKRSGQDEAARQVLMERNEICRAKHPFVFGIDRYRTY